MPFLVPFKRLAFPTFIPLLNSGKGWAGNFLLAPKNFSLKESKKSL
jgi:hypothetical protein